MTLKDKEVIEYKLDSLDMIIGYQLYNKKKRPDLIGYIDPPDQMIEEGFLDEYNRPCWLHTGTEINKVDLGEPTPVEDASRFMQELTRVEMLKLIDKGIQNKNDPDYLDLMDKVNLL